MNKVLLHAVTKQTTVELITVRASTDDAHFGLRAWSGGRVRRHDILIAKNDLSEDETDTLSRLMVIFPQTVEMRGKRRQDIPMRLWVENVRQIIGTNGFPSLTSAGSISHEQMEARTSERHLAFDEQLKPQ